ncbi:MAG: nucleoside hydrolase, partial [Anaerolineaceae bacterium]|nr:nucleoside hydrolase [Anaerolineaceae bacterium]
FGNLKRIVCMGGYLEPLRIGWRNLKELNFSANPQAAYSVLNADCPVTVMNGHICTQAYLGRQEIEHLTFWPKAFRSMLKRWLITFGLYCGVDVFYLWDLLPAVYLNHPELFEPSQFNCSSSIDDLITGMLVKAKDPLGKQIEMPLNIVDSDKFYRTVTQGWQEAARIYPLSD